MLNSIAGKTYALFENPGTKKIIAELESNKARVLRFPALETEHTVLNEDAEEFTVRLKQFDWLIFTDVFTVEYFLQILEEKAIDFYELDDVRVCVFGETVSDKLRFAQLHADVVPATLEPNEIVNALKNYIGEEKFSRQKFLLLKEAAVESELKNELAQFGRISELSVYRIKQPVDTEIARLKTLLKGGAVDEFIFSGSSDFIYLNFLFNGESLDRLLFGINVSAIDNSIFQTAKEHKLEQAVLWRPPKIDKVEK